MSPSEQHVRSRRSINPLCTTQGVSGMLRRYPEVKWGNVTQAPPHKYCPFPRQGWNLNMPACSEEEETCPASTLLDLDKYFGQIHLTACKANYLSPDPNRRFSHGIELQILVFPLDPATSSPSSQKSLRQDSRKRGCQRPGG